MLHSSVLATIGLLAAQSAAASVKRQGTIKPLFDSPEPYYDHDLGTPSDCTIWWNTDDGIGCDTVLLIANISVEQLALLVKLISDQTTNYTSPGPRTLR